MSQLTDKRTSGFPLAVEFLSSHMALLEGDLAVFDFERAYAAVAVEPLTHREHRGPRVWQRGSNRFTYRVIFNEGRELRVGHDTVEGSVDVGRDLPINLEVRNVTFQAAWFHEPGELRLVREVQERLPRGW